MADFLTPSQRSERMARIRSKDTSPELALRKALHARGFRFRVNVRGLTGRPDIVLAKYRAAIFVHGCFWHRHEGCKVATTPKSNTGFWMEKFERTVLRDARVAVELASHGWRIFTAWECELDSARKVAKKADCLASHLRDFGDTSSTLADGGCESAWNFGSDAVSMKAVSDRR